MKVVVAAVGRPRGALAEAIAEYEERASRYWKLESLWVEAGAPGSRPDPDAVRTAEAARILARIPDQGELIALTRAGKGWTSVRLARFLEERGLRSTPAVTFVVGGAFGLGEDVLARAGHRLSLSDFTLPHDLARLVLAEQLYRAGTILRNEPYHKGTVG